MSAVITAATTLFTNMFGASGWISKVITLITGNDFLLLGVALMVAGAAVSYLSRLIRY